MSTHLSRSSYGSKVSWMIRSSSKTLSILVLCFLFPWSESRPLDERDSARPLSRPLLPVNSQKKRTADKKTARCCFRNYDFLLHWAHWAVSGVEDDNFRPCTSAEGWQQACLLFRRKHSNCLPVTFGLLSQRIDYSVSQRERQTAFAFHMVVSGTLVATAVRFRMLSFPIFALVFSQKERHHEFRRRKLGLVTVLQHPKQLHGNKTDEYG